MSGIIAGAKSIGMFSVVPESSTLPPYAGDTGQIIQNLLSRVDDLQTLVEGKADANRIKTLIQYSNETIRIQADEIALVGAVTFLDVWKDHTGALTGQVDPSLTRIRGGVIQTGTIISNNWSSSAGSAFDLDNGTFTLGGSSSPKFSWDGTDLNIVGNGTFTGTLTAGSIIAGAVMVGGVALSTISSNASTGASHASATGNPHGVTLTQISGDLDDIADGSSYFKANATQLAGGDRAAVGLDSNGKYIKEISTQLIAVSGSNPSNGLIIDTNGLRLYQSSVLKVNLSAAGVAVAGDISGSTGTFSGNLNTSGQVIATGQNTNGGIVAAGHFVPSSGGMAIYGNSGSSTSPTIQIDHTGGNGFGLLCQGANYGAFFSANASGGAAIAAVAGGSATVALALTGAMTISSTTAVTNLNADMVDGKHASALMEMNVATFNDLATSTTWRKVETSADGINVASQIYVRVNNW